MAGHSKWANIKHRKEKADQKKGKIFSRAIKEIITAVKQAGSDPKTNARLRIAIDKAKEANVPNENIERNIKKASDPNTADYTAMEYELYGYGGVGLIVSILTDNKNRISSDIRIAINKCGGTIATPGAVSFNFERKGVIDIEKSSILEEDLFLLATDSGAEDLEVEEDFYRILTTVEDFIKVKEALQKSCAKILEADLQMVPKNWIEPTDEEAALNIALIDWLEKLDDVDAVYHNMGKN